MYVLFFINWQCKVVNSFQIRSARGVHIEGENTNVECVRQGLVTLSALLYYTSHHVILIVVELKPCKLLTGNSGSQVENLRNKWQFNPLLVETVKKITQAYTSHVLEWGRRLLKAEVKGIKHNLIPYVGQLELANVTIEG